MEKQEFIEKLNNFGFPKTEFVILSGGSLLLRGLREETADFERYPGSQTQAHETEGHKRHRSD